MSSSKEGLAPSTRRLQARAAKSAIRRVQEIYDPSAARNELEKIANDDTLSEEELRRRAAAMRQQAEEEVQFLADELTELIPTDRSLDSLGTTRMQQYHVAPSDFTRKSNHEYVMTKKNVGGDDMNASDDSDFVNAWWNQRSSQLGSTTDESTDSDLEDIVLA